VDTGRFIDMPDQALRAILRTAGLEAGGGARVRFTGGADPVVPTPFRVGAAGAAAVAATGLAAADLWQGRTGRSQNVTVDVRQATASLRSYRYLRIDGSPVPAGRDAVTGSYPTRDGGWIYIHANFPHHRAAALGVLGVADDRGAVARAAAGWDAGALEEAILAAGGAGGMARSQAMWGAHPQRAAVARLPLLEILRIGDGPAEPLAAAERPLSGVRVLDLTRVLAGPTAARTLAEHGADVLRITAAHLPSVEAQELDTGHGKLSARLDLREPTERAALLGLVRQADVFSQGYRPGALAALGLSPAALAVVRPGIICLSLSAFGHTGPWALRRGFDTVVQAVSGIALRQGEAVPGSAPGPQFYPVSAIDYCSGYLMAFGAMVALRRRALEGGSWLVRVSLARVGEWLVGLGEAALGPVAAEFSDEDVARWSVESATPSGRLRHLGPVAGLSETPAYWARPAVPLGYHPPVWPDAG
jgi:crotonobetainyl-CoA:carnitine CoA-transferase CaiB-like acyl-CoA transferase